MPASPDQLQADLSALNQARAARGYGALDEAIGAAADRDAVITPVGRERFSWEKIANLPREVTNYQIFGKSVGDLAKEAAVSGAAGALFRIGLGSAGLGGIGLAAAAGGGVSGLREHYKRTNETWARMRQDQNIAEGKKLGKGDTLKGFFNPDHKASVALAVGRGAAFGATGGIVGGWLVETPVAEAVRRGFSAVGGIKDAVGGVKDAALAWKDSNIGTPEIKSDTPILGRLAGAQPAPEVSAPAEVKIPEVVSPPVAEGPKIEAGPNSPEIKLPENLQPREQWMLEANDINKDYGLMKQAEVGKIVPKIDEFLAAQNITPANTDPIRYETLRDQLIGNAESKINKVFDSHLQEAVERGMSLDQVHQTWNKDFTSWVDTGMNGDLTTSLQSIQQGMVQIDQVVSIPTNLTPVGSYFEPSTGKPFDTSFQWSDQTLDWWNQNAKAYGALVAVNYDTFFESWKRAYPNLEFPVHLGEIKYLVEAVERGGSDSTEALTRLKAILKGISGGEKLIRLRIVGVDEVWKILTNLK